MNKIFLKVILSLSISFIVCSTFAGLYYNIPLKHVNNTGATDYVWQPNKFYSRGTEGYAMGKTNNEGFNNLEDYNGQKINTLLMGSSHMEGFNVSQNKTTVALLNKNLGKDFYTYNIGISGHTIYTQISNLEYALKTYNPTNYVILETMNIPNDINSLDQILNNEVQSVGSVTNGFVRYLESFDYLKLLSSQIKSYINNNRSETSNETKVNQIQKNDYIEKLNQVLLYIRDCCNKKGVQPIILLHQHLMLQEDGSIKPSIDKNEISIFKKLCEENDIILVDMTKKFIDMYKYENILPYGFSNTKIGEGHLNVNGHAMIAEELSIIMQKEGIDK